MPDAVDRSSSKLATAVRALRLWELSSNPASALWLLRCLVAADLLFLALHGAHVAGLTRDAIFSLEGDRVAGEFFQYVKQYWIAGAMLVLFRRRRRALYAVWSAVFAYLLADDCLLIHERTGTRIGEALGVPAGARLSPTDTGQTLFALAAAALVLVVLAVLRRHADSDARRVSRAAVRGLFLVGVCGVGFDLLHALTGSAALVVLEEGGEMLAMSLTCAVLVSEVAPFGFAGKGQERAARPSAAGVWH